MEEKYKGWPVVELVRLETSRAGTFGVLRINKQVHCVTLEPGDLLNRLNYSSIPAGSYWCYKDNSLRHGPTFEVADIPGRTDILFHAGNTMKDTGGCILLGEHFGKLRGDRAVLNSGKTFRGFLAFFKDVKKFYLTITENY